VRYMRSRRERTKVERSAPPEDGEATEWNALQGQEGRRATREIAASVSLDVHLLEGGHFGDDMVEGSLQRPGGAVGLHIAGAQPKVKERRK
jgi:hypothetical protein